MAFIGGRCLLEGGVYICVNVHSFNSVTATVTGKRKRDMGLVVPARFNCMAKKKAFAKILLMELVKKRNKYSYFELNVVDFVDKRKENNLNSFHCLFVSFLLMFLINAILRCGVY